MKLVAVDRGMDGLQHGFPTRDPPGCIVRPATKVVNCVLHNTSYTIIRQLGTPLTLICHVRPPNKLTLTVVARGLEALN